MEIQDVAEHHKSHDAIEYTKVQIVLERAIFAHDDKSIRPVVLIKGEGAVSIALFNFRTMDFVQSKKDSVDKAILEIDLKFFDNVSARFILVPSSEL